MDICTMIGLRHLSLGKTKPNEFQSGTSTFCRDRFIMKMLSVNPSHNLFKSLHLAFYDIRIRTTPKVFKIAEAVTKLPAYTGLLTTGCYWTLNSCQVIRWTYPPPRYWRATGAGAYIKGTFLLITMEIKRYWPFLQHSILAFLSLCCINPAILGSIDIF